MTAALHESVAASAARRPEAVAVVDGERTLTYGELLHASRALAHRLTEAGVGGGDRVAFLLPKSLEAVVAMLAVLQVGAAFTPLDPAGPAPRWRATLALGRPQLLLSGPEAGAPAFDPPLDPAPQRLTMPALAEMLDDPERAPGPATEAAALAYLLFTSGTTGAPKGVPIGHGSVSAFVRWANHHFGTGPGDRVSGHSPLHFDLAMYDVFGALVAGAELHLVPPTAGLLPRSLVDFIEERELTQWFSVPSVLRAVAGADALRGRTLPALRRVLWCGEVLEPTPLRYWMERLPAASYTNLYGPTEATIASTFHAVTVPPQDQTPVPIGRACPGESVVIVDAELAPVAAGDVGELCIGGAGLSPGYWDDPARTAAAFVELDPERWPDVEHRRVYRTGDLARRDDDGVLHFLGRADRQIKSRGHRIELDEIAGALLAADEVTAASVVAVESDGFEGTTICAAFVPADDASPAALRRALSSTLPVYMIPTRWLRLDTVPLNGNGKVDNRAVAELFRSGADRAKPALAGGGGR